MLILIISWYSYTCTNNNIGLASDQSVRLIGGSHSREGIVEITFNGRWGMVCNQDFSVVDAQSICRGLGYGTDDTSVRSSSR